ncbi:hypothetical protein EJB05_16226, partial [Eragrostis curvula]
MEGLKGLLEAKEAYFARALKWFPVCAAILDGTLSADVSGGGDGEDRISALPDELRCNIVSRLRIKDAVRTTVLSTRAVNRCLLEGACGPRTYPHRHPPRCKELQRLYLGFWVFPDTAELPDGAGVFPDLRELAMVNTFMEQRDMDHMVASSPLLETLALFGIFAKMRHLRLCGQKLRCVFFSQSKAMVVTVVDAPILERLILRDTRSPADCKGALMRVKIPKDASELKVLGFLEPRIHELQIGNTVIKDDTKVSPRSMVPSVKILAIKLNLVF